MEKRCSSCKRVKDITDFPRSSRTICGRSARCKVCINAVNREYRNANREKWSQSRKRHYRANIEKMRAQKVAYGQAHKEEKSAYDRVYRQANPDRIREHKRAWARRNVDNIEVRLKRNLRRRIHHVIKGTNKAGTTFELLGCDLETLKKHIEAQFTGEMCWENYGQFGWHIDHIRPCYEFDLTDNEQQKICFHYRNLRPLWWLENISRRRT